MTREPRTAFEKSFFRHLHPDAADRSPVGPSPAPVTPAEYAALDALQAIVAERMRRIPEEIADQLAFAARRGPDAVRAVIQTAVDDALRELAACGE